MAKITIVGDAIVVTSAVKLESIKALEAYGSKALSLFEKDENGKSEAVFKVGTTTGKGSINKYGASFNGETHNAEKLATITLEIPAGVEDAQAYAVEKIGRAIIMLNKVEEQIPAALEAVAAERAAISACITMA